jgi:hypothetical protein
MVPGKTEGDLVDEYILHDESPGKTLQTSFFEEKHDKVTTHGRVSFSSAASVFRRRKHGQHPVSRRVGEKASLWRVSQSTMMRCNIKGLRF